MNRTTLLKLLASTSLGLPFATAQWRPSDGTDAQRPEQRDHVSGSYGEDRSSGRDDYYDPRARRSPGTLWFSQSYPPGSQPVQKGAPGGAGLWEIGFNGASSGLNVRPGDELFCWVQLNGASLPREILLAFNDGSSWEHRAYWGENRITYGKDGTSSRLPAGPLPSSDGWIKLTIPARSVGLSGQITGMTISLEGGQARFGAVGAQPQGTGRYGYGPSGQPGSPSASAAAGETSDDQRPRYNRDERDRTFPGDEPREDR